MPNLWRSPSGFVDEDGNFSSGQLVARGIENLQVEYRDGNSASFKASPELVNATLANVVREVRVTLGARALSRKLQGETAGGAAGTALRGQLVSTITPRAALVALSRLDNPAANEWR